MSMWENIQKYAISVYLCAQNPIFLFLFVSLILDLLIIAFTNKETLNNNRFLHLFCIVGPPTLLMMYYVWTHSRDSGVIVLGVIGLVLFAVAAYELYSVSNSPYFQFAGTATTYIFIFGALVVLHAILLVIIEDWIVAQTGWFGLALDLWFFIPCMIRDVIVFFMGELANTSRVLYVLFFTEILIIVGYVYFPTIWGWLTQPLHSQPILKGGIYLNTAQTISGQQTPWLDTSQPNGPHFRHNYGISFWWNVTSHSPSANGYGKPSRVFDFGKGKPTLKWNPKNREKPRTNDDFSVENRDIGEYELIIGEDQKISVSLETAPFQKWNCFYIQYSEGNQVDVFVNGKLIHTGKLNQPAVFVSGTVMTAGDTEGIQGVIAGVNYYTKSISLSEIRNIPFPQLLVS